MNRIIPCLWFNDEAESLADFYVRTLPGAKVLTTSRYPRGLDNPGGRPAGSVLEMVLEVSGRRISVLNGGPHFKVSPVLSFFLFRRSASEVEQLCAKLGEGGSSLMPFGKYPWSDAYGWVQDRFGVSWQIMSSNVDELVPCVMFAGPHHLKAEPAIRHWVETIPGSTVGTLERYVEGEGPVGSIKHGRFTLDGQPFVAMDAHGPHPFTFNEGVSFQVMCDDQRELDRVTAALVSEGGSQGPCGWVKDRFGFSWQTVPTAVPRMLTSGDDAACSRMFTAMMGMKKLDIAKLEAAYRG